MFNPIWFSKFEGINKPSIIYNKGVKMKKSLSRATLALVTFLSTPATAELIEAVPTNWRMQDYMNDSVLLFYTGSSCQNGSLVFIPQATTADKDRLWSLIMTAKIAGKPVGIFYSVDQGNCLITSFYMQ